MPFGVALQLRAEGGPALLRGAKGNRKWSTVGGIPSDDRRRFPTIQFKDVLDDIRELIGQSFLFGTDHSRSINVQLRGASEIALIIATRLLLSNSRLYGSTRISEELFTTQGERDAPTASVCDLS